MGILAAIRKKRLLREISRRKWFHGGFQKELGGLDVDHLETIRDALALVPEDTEARKLFVAVVTLCASEGFDVASLHADSWFGLETSLRDRIALRADEVLPGLARSVAAALPKGLPLDRNHLREDLITSMAGGESAAASVRRLEDSATRESFPYCPGLKAWAGERIAVACNLVLEADLWSRHPDLTPDRGSILGALRSCLGPWMEPVSAADLVLDRIRSAPSGFTRDFTGWIDGRIDKVLEDLRPKLMDMAHPGASIHQGRSREAMKRLMLDKSLDDLERVFDNLGDTFTSMFAVNSDYFLAKPEPKVPDPRKDEELYRKIQEMTRNAALHRADSDSDQAMTARVRPQLFKGPW